MVAAMASLFLVVKGAIGVPVSGSIALFAAGLAIYLFVQVVYTGFYGINPVRAQERLLKDYLEARKIIRERAKS